MFDLIDSQLNKHFNKGDSKPNNIEMIYFLFWEKGIDLEQMDKLPIPYILSILKVNQYVIKEQEKEMKKAKRNG